MSRYHFTPLSFPKVHGSMRRLILFVVYMSAMFSCPLLIKADEGIEFYEKRIRPVLIEHCYRCHSEQSKKLMGGLRLDLKSGWQTGGESGQPAIVPGKPHESPLIQAVRHDEDASAMPPGKLRLSEQVLSDLSEWVRIGAPAPPDKATSLSPKDRWQAEFQKRLDWWSLRPVANFTPPQAADGWAMNAVDRFVHDKLRQQHLRPAPDADALVLLRRLSFVLTGLPPTVDQVKAFPARFQHNAEEALANVVDDLLKSPHFGERIARHWMDVVRYTDTYGYEWDNPAKGSWEYRDYLIRAFNNDTGFNQLIREQIAGDLLTKPRIDTASGFNESLIGPMFYHMGEHRHGDNEVINGVREEMIDNKIDAFSKAFLAMTIACARCHDHKLDAVSQKDYYAMAGVLMTPRWTSRPIDAPAKNQKTIDELRHLRTAIQKQLAEMWAELAEKLATGDSIRKAALKMDRAELAKAKTGDVEWLLHNLLPKKSEPAWREINQLSATSINGTTLAIEPDGSILATGDTPATDSYSVRFHTKPGVIDQIRLQALTHNSLGNRGPGRSPHGNFVLSHIRVSVRPFTESANQGIPPAPGKSQDVPLASARADYEQPNYPVADALKPAATDGWGIGLGGNVDRTAWFTFTRPVDLPHGGQWTITLEQGYGSRHTLGRFRLTAGAESALQTAESEKLANDAATTAAWQRLATEWRTTNRQRLDANSKFRTLVDFSRPDWPQGFVAEGEGMRTGFIAGGEPLVALSGDAAIERLLPRGYHTHALSSKLPGALRLPRQDDLSGPFLSVKLAGDQWSGYLRVSDNGFQTENVTFLSQLQPDWKPFADISKANGIQRVSYEIATSDLNPNFPPRTGLARAGGTTLPPADEGFDKRSWFSVTGVVGHDQPGQPQDDLQRLKSLFDAPAPTSFSEAWQRVGRWLAESVERCRSGAADSGDVQLVNWLMARGLLPNRLADDAQLAALVQQYRAVEASLPFPHTCNSMDERSVAPINYALNIRGDINRRSSVVPRGLPEFASALASGSYRSETTDNSGSGRLELAEFLADPRHGLAARVFVNRVWQWVFGDGLVRTPNDFGHLGEPPANPELLDYLTREFMADGWSVKRLIRRLVMSHTFRQSGIFSAEASAIDPTNRWLHHYPTRRLEAEAIRDSLLAVSGRIDPKLYGRPINPQRQVEDPAKRLFSGPIDGNGRRSIYLEVSIMDRSKFLQSFNAPDPKLSTGRRDATNVPAQALVMLNDPLLLLLADHWSQSLVADESQTVDQRIKLMFVRALGREPEAKELAEWAALAKELSKNDQILKDRDVWKNVAHTMFNLQEFMHYR